MLWRTTRTTCGTREYWSPLAGLVGWLVLWAGWSCGLCDNGALFLELSMAHKLLTRSCHVRLLPCRIREEKVSSAIGAEDKEKMEKALHDAMDWLDHNQQAEVEEFEHKLKELEDVCQPIITKMYQGGAGAAAAGAGMPGGAGGSAPPPRSGGAGPKIEEVD
jgi:hypothetical protein